MRLIPAAALLICLVASTLSASPLSASPLAGHDFSFTAIEGESLPLNDYAGHPVLVVNTASLCAYTPQYDDLQALQDTYAPRGLVVLAVPSDDFNQELASAAEVKEFCALNYNLTLPMTEITHVKGPQAHPFYQWLAAEHGFTPGWNFTKVLIGPDGAVVETWGSNTTPMSAKITSQIERLLAP